MTMGSGFLSPEEMGVDNPDTTPTQSGFTTQTEARSGFLDNVLATKEGRFGLGVLTTAGKALQPFMAPQQVIFGAIGWTQKMLEGDFQGAAETFKRGAGAAGDFLTYGLTAKYLGNKKDDRDTYISGYQLAKNAGYSDLIAKPLGLATDFILDVPALGTIGRLSGLSKLADVSSSVNHIATANMAFSFTRDANGAVDLAGLRKFAIRVAAAPLSTAPVHDLATGLPQYYRQAVSQAAARVIEEGIKVSPPGLDRSYTVFGGRRVKVQGGGDKARDEPLGGTAAQWLVNKYGGLRGVQRMEGTAIADLKNGKISGTGASQKLEKEFYQANSEGGSITLRAAQAESRWDALNQGLTRKSQDEFGRIAYRILDWDNVSDFHKGLSDLENFSQSIGRPAFKQDALKALWESTALDTYMGLLRFKSGTMSAEATSGYFQGLRTFERAAFGQPKTANPLAPQFAAAARTARNTPSPIGTLPNPANPAVPIVQMAALRPVLPETALHFRRSYNLQFQPMDVIEQVRASNLPGIMHQVDEARLTDTMLGMLNIRHMRNGGTNQSLVGMRPAYEAAAGNLAADFTKMFKGQNVDERTAMSALLSKHGFAPEDLKDVLQHVGQEWYQKAGIAYRPPSDELATKLMEMADNSSMVGGAGSKVDLGTNNAVLQGRTDLPDYYREAMGQITDIGKLLQQTRNIGVKQYTNRKMVQSTFDFLTDEGAILTKEELMQLPGGAHNNWRRVSTDLAAKLKAMGDDANGVTDLPFKGHEYIPAAYHDLLTMASRIDDPSVLNTTFSYLMQAWKGHKVGNVASIVRDTLTNYRFAADMGIDPASLTRAVVAGMTLTNKATEGGALGRLRGARPDVLDPKAYVVYRGTKITMQELTDVGGMFHGSFFVNEMKEPYRALRDSLASNRGSGTQGVVAAVLDYADMLRGKIGDAAASKNPLAKVAGAAGTAVAGAADLATGLGGPVTKMLGDIKGSVDVIYKLGVYMHKRSEGMSSIDAARHADELLFNYQNQPLMVDYLRRNGISPFAAFQFMSTGRLMRNLYENPYAVARWYRLPQSATAGDERTQGEVNYTAPEYMRKQLWFPLFNPFDKAADGKAVRDSQNRSMFANLSSVMPESSVFNLTGTDAISQWIPPHIELMMQIQSGQGYGGTPLYDGGKDLMTTLRSGNKNAVAKGVVKALHQFGASPWAPGSPQADRFARAIADSAVPADQIANNPEVQAWLKVMTEGVFAAPLQNTPIVPQRLGAAAPLDPGYAAGRFFGATTSPVTGYGGKPGSAVGNLQGLSIDVKNLRAQMVNDIKDAGADPEAVKRIYAKYMPLIEAKSAKIETARTFMEKYEQSYQSEMPR